MKSRPSARSGRPSRDLAAKVDERILDAAEQVFLARGFEGASIDEIAEVGRAGKPTIYARHAGKRELFTAVVLRNVARALQVNDSPLAGSTTEERLQAVGISLLQGAMSPATIGLFRVTLSEAHRFPELAAQVSHLGRERGINMVARVLEEVDGSRREAKGVILRSNDPLKAARIFMDLVVLPVIMRRLFGDSAEVLEAEIPRHVADRVAFFLAAGRAGDDGMTPAPLAFGGHDRGGRGA